MKRPRVLSSYCRGTWALLSLLAAQACVDNPKSDRTSTWISGTISFSGEYILLETHDGSVYQGGWSVHSYLDGQRYKTLLGDCYGQAFAGPLLVHMSRDAKGAGFALYDFGRLKPVSLSKKSRLVTVWGLSQRGTCRSSPRHSV